MGRKIGKYLVGMVVFWWLWQGGVAVAAVDHKPRVEIRLNVRLRKKGHPTGRTPNIKWLLDWLKAQAQTGVEPNSLIKAFAVRFCCNDKENSLESQLKEMEDVAQEDSLGRRFSLEGHPYLVELMKEISCLREWNIPIKCVFGMGRLTETSEHWGEEQSRMARIWGLATTEHTPGVLPPDSSDRRTNQKKWLREVCRWANVGSHILMSPIGGTDIICPGFRPDDKNTKNVLAEIGGESLDIGANPLVHCAMLGRAAQGLSLIHI